MISLKRPIGKTNASGCLYRIYRDSTQDILHRDTARKHWTLRREVGFCYVDISAISLMVAVISSEALATLLPVLCPTQAQQTASLSGTIIYMPHLAGTETFHYSH